MGPGVGSDVVGTSPTAVTSASQGCGLEAGHWRRAAGRVAAYLAALGVQEPREVELLWGKVRLRVEARAAVVPLENPVEAAIEETHGLLDLWIASELGLEGDANTLCAARAVVLGGGVPGWSARWAGLSEHSLAPEIRALCVNAVPEPAPLTMEPNPIDLFMHRLGARLAAMIRCILGRPGDPDAAARGHP